MSEDRGIEHAPARYDYDSKAVRAFLRRAKLSKNLGTWNVPPKDEIDFENSYHARVFIDAIIGIQEDSVMQKYGEDSEQYRRNLARQTMLLEFLTTNDMCQFNNLGDEDGKPRNKTANDWILGIATEGAQHIRDKISPGSEAKTPEKKSGAKEPTPHGQVIKDLERTGKISAEHAELLRTFFVIKPIKESDANLGRLQAEIKPLAADMMMRATMISRTSDLDQKTAGGIVCIKTLSSPSQAGAWSPSLMKLLVDRVKENPKYHKVRISEIERNIQQSIAYALKEFYDSRHTAVLDGISRRQSH